MTLSSDDPRPRQPKKNAARWEWTNYAEQLELWEGRESLRKALGGGGTQNSTAFRTRERTDGSGKTDVFFNGPGDGAAHGHVVEGGTNANGSTNYIYARDVEGNEYDVD
jgi:hypothetical protein